MSSTAQGYGRGGEEEQVLLHPPQPNLAGFICHVPQQSRREKLRFPPEESPAGATTPSIPAIYQEADNYYLPVPSFPCSSSSSMTSHDVLLGGEGVYQIQKLGFSLSLSPAVGSLGPFTGYAAVLNRSRFVEPARQLLEEICVLSRGVALGGRDLPDDLMVDGDVQEYVRDKEQQWKKTKLISMLDEVYRRYRFYYRQVQTVTTSFEAVAGLNSAAPYVFTALKSMSRHFRSLKNAIGSHLNRAAGKEDLGKEGFSGLGLINAETYSQRGNSSATFRQPPIWRPQRGLPERAVTVLRAWLFEHFLHPYPTDTDKQMLAKKTGLTRNQVSNWFINARVRLWKPMVEEVHNLDTRQSQKAVAAETSDKHALQPSSSAATSSSNPPPAPQNSSVQTNQNPYTKSSNNQLQHIAHHIQEPYNFVFDGFCSHAQTGGIPLGGTSGVSLTLGLHQHDGVGVPQPSGFGLEECNDAYVFGAMDGQDRHMGKDIGAHLLHDFVG
ncbi:hypothetical protein HPP92_001494 [Vanilla planifolia]|uniref:Homeobox domain-containing protein n=1 Tax=Vanilla planifolia TaxID=51239 RepID=A0A835S3I4_VANPL|nr:hypothetical protein HPP92_001494 [Vanilla planifolia]